MKKIIIFLCAYVLSSCTTQKVTHSSFITTYKRDYSGHVLPEYILLKTPTKSFEIFSPSIYTSVFGTWNINNDTLFLFPQNVSYNRDDSLFFINVTSNNTSILSFPQRLLIKKDYIIDITDYNNDSPELIELFGNQNDSTIYYKINSN